MARRSAAALPLFGGSALPLFGGPAPLRLARTRLMGFMPGLGVDPGSWSGGAVLLDGDGLTVITWWAWLRLADGGPPLRLHSGRGDTRLESVAEAGRVIGAEMVGLGVGDHVRAIEGLFVPGPDRDPTNVLPLAESVGELRAGLPTPEAECRPLASEWRPQMLGIPPWTPAAVAEEVAIRHALAAFDWPRGRSGCATDQERGAVAEAAWLARWALEACTVGREAM